MLIQVRELQRFAIKFVLGVRKKMVNILVYIIKTFTRWLEKQYFTHSLRLFVKYCFHHSKIKFISSRPHVMYSLYTRNFNFSFEKFYFRNFSFEKF